MRKPGPSDGIAKITFLRQHEGNRARRRGFETVAGDGSLGSFDQILLRGARQGPLGTLEILRQLGPRRWRVEAVRRTYPGIPEIGIIEAGCPGAFDEAHEAV